MHTNNYQYHRSKNEDLVTNTNNTNNILIWLDEEASNSTSFDTELTIDVFNSIANTDCKLYNSLELFLTEVAGMTTTGRIMVITSGSFAERLLSRLSLSLLRELSSIFIFCEDSTKYQYLLKKYRKVVHICTDAQLLKEAIQDELNPPTDFLVLDRDLNPLFNLNDDGQNFNLYKQYIELLRHYPWATANRTKMIDECIKHYRKDAGERRKINEFQNSYTPETAIKWYTRDCFLYRLVNKALRSLDMEQMIIYRPYIRDLCTQLQHLHEQDQSDTPLVVYCGHPNMTIDQFENIKSNIGSSISFNGFLSTTKDEKTAMIFAESSSTQTKSVLFEIRTNYNSKNVVFADISRLSDMEDEQEVLFNLCSIFRIEAIEDDEENQLSKIIISATNEDTVNKLEQVDIEIIQDEREQCLSFINQYCRRHNIIKIVASIFFILIMAFVMTFSISIKLKDQTQSSYNCVGPNCTILNTTSEIKFNKWKQNGTTVAGGNGEGKELNQLNWPLGIFIDTNKNIFIADWKNHRIVEWQSNENKGNVVAGGNGKGERRDQLSFPTDVIVDQINHSLIIADYENRRIVRWYWNQNEQEILIENIRCWGLRMDRNGFIYVSEWAKGEVRKWKIGEKGEGTLVAGGNENGNKSNQLNYPTYIFVDDQQSVYVSDRNNHRVMKWLKNAREGIVVAGGNGQGNNLNQLSNPYGLIVDDFGQIYVVDGGNNRIMRWSKEKTEGEIIVGGNGKENELNQLSSPADLSFDVEGNLHVSDSGNHRVQRFDLI